MGPPFIREAALAASFFMPVVRLLVPSGEPHRAEGAPPRTTGSPVRPVPFHLPSFPVFFVLSRLLGVSSPSGSGQSVRFVPQGVPRHRAPVPASPPLLFRIRLPGVAAMTAPASGRRRIWVAGFHCNSPHSSDRSCFSCCPVACGKTFRNHRTGSRNPSVPKRSGKGRESRQNVGRFEGGTRIGPARSSGRA